jgi:hypothetical protein
LNQRAYGKWLMADSQNSELHAIGYMLLAL